MNANTRRNLLGGGVLLLLVFVVADRTGMLDRLRGGDGEAGAQQQLAADASLLARQWALVDAQPAWSAAEAQADRAWQDLRSSVIRAETRPLAEAELRERLRAALSNLPGIRAPEAVSIARPATPGADAAARQPAATTGPRVERLRFRVGFDAAEHPDAIEAIDRLARLSSPRIRLESLSIIGPGELQQAQTGLTVSLEVEAVAIIGASPDARLTRTDPDRQPASERGRG